MKSKNIWVKNRRVTQLKKLSWTSYQHFFVSSPMIYHNIRPIVIQGMLFFKKNFNVVEQSLAHDPQ